MEIENKGVSNNLKEHFPDKLFGYPLLYYIVYTANCINLFKQDLVFSSSRSYVDNK